MGCKAAETTHTINNAFGPGTANKCIVQWCFKQFCKDESLEDKKHSGQPLQVDNNKLRAIIKADLLTTTRETAKELNISHSRSPSICSKLEKWKSGWLISWPQIKTTVIFEVSSIFLFTQQQWTISRSDCNKKWILYNNQWQHTQWLDWEEALMHFPKLNLHQKRSWSLSGGLLPI